MTQKEKKPIYARRVQRTGGVSDLVVLPKEWTEKHGVAPGDIMLIWETKSGALKMCKSNCQPKGREI